MPDIADWDRIDACEYLFLRELSEPDENSLLLVVDEAAVASDSEDIEILGTAIEGTREIRTDETCQAFELWWESYVAYFVLNESFSLGVDAGEEYVGKLLRRYTRSRLMEFLLETSFASDEYPRAMTHWEVVCGNHIISVVSTSTPRLRVL